MLWFLPWCLLPLLIYGIAPSLNLLPQIINMAMGFLCVGFLLFTISIFTKGGIGGGDIKITALLGLIYLTDGILRHSSSTYKLEISDGDIKSTQADTGHTNTQTLLKTYAHSREERRKEMLKAIEDDFYNQKENEEKKKYENQIEQIIKVLESCPDIKKRVLEVILT